MSSRLPPSPNLPYAIRIDGRFTSVKARSIPRQQKPYPPLAAAAEKQAVFELANVKGVIVAFRYPAYLAGVNMPGYHCHFITADRRAGGHLLDCRVEGATVAVDALANFFLRLPDTPGVFNVGLNRRPAPRVGKNRALSSPGRPMARPAPGYHSLSQIRLGKVVRTTRSQNNF